MSPQMERQFHGGQVGQSDRGEKGQKGVEHTHRHKMGGAHFDMSAPDIRDKPEESSNIQPGVWDCGAESQTKLLIEWMVSGCEI